jgi:hypothetical protein
VSESGQQPTDPQEPQTEALDPALSALALIAGRISTPVKLVEAGPSEPLRKPTAQPDAPAPAPRAATPQPPSARPAPQPPRTPAAQVAPLEPAPQPAPDQPSPAPRVQVEPPSEADNATQSLHPTQPPAGQIAAEPSAPQQQPDPVAVAPVSAAPTPIVEPEAELAAVEPPVEPPGAIPAPPSPGPAREPTPVMPPPARQFSPQRPALDQVAERLRERSVSTEPVMRSGLDFEPSTNAERIVPRQAPQQQLDNEAGQGTEPRVARPNRLVLATAVLSIVFGLGAMVASAWVYSEAQRDLRQLLSDLAQMRVSLELFARQQTAGPDLDEVYGRLQQVEQSVRDAIAAIPTPQDTSAGVPAIPSVGLGPSAQSDGDCLPPGTRFLVTTGDRYPVCGTQGVLEILSVGALDIALGDGSAIAIGGSTTLPNTSCTVSVLSANADGMSGYGEIRVNC